MTEHPTHRARELRLAEVLVDLADTLDGDFDVGVFLERVADRCVELLDVTAAGLLLDDGRGELRTAAGCGGAGELLRRQREEGPCLDCYRGSDVVTAPDLARCDDRWPRFAPLARDRGFHATYAVPLRRRAEVIGALNLFRGVPGDPPGGDVALARAFADAAAIGILQERARQRQEALAAQLQAALDSRVVLEQAKGVLAERWGVGVDEAFTALRRYARTHRVRLAVLARGVVAGTVDSDALRGAGD
ncbi:GAF and ANTAR domain-containing protein [Streptomyces sp. PA03-1a]|nr:GAF and ANTAR domain-containing protein [Streptomyces sp. PA03-1a]MDX2818612.1 GAF and ANTAR domain-containing protein [Streptomyces sp. PA03-5A]